MAPVAGDTWGKDFEEAVKLLDDLGPLMDERNETIRRRQDPSRVVATLRRKLTMLTTKADRLESVLRSMQEQSTLPVKECRRREDLLLGLRYKAKEMAAVLSSGQQANRAALLQGSAGPVSYAPVETPETAALDNQALLTMQKQTIRDQEEELLELESTVTSTKNIAVTIHGELDLHQRLLDDLDEDLQSTGARMEMVRKKLTYFTRDAERTCNMCATVVIVTGLVFVSLLIYTILEIFY